MIIQNIILAMSLSGSVVVFLYLLIYPLAKQYFSPKWRYLVLKLAVVFYLVPFPYFTCESNFFYWLRSVNPLIRNICPGGFYVSYRTTKQLLKMAVSIESSGQLLLSRKMKYTLLGMAVFLLIAFAAVLWHLIRYQRTKRRCLNSTGEVGKEQRKLFQRIKDQVGVRRKVRLVSSEYCGSPMVMGILSPVVVFPAREKSFGFSDEYMMKHELFHVRNQDLLVKFLGFAALAVHWFNPLCYILYHELVSMSEICCDGDVLRGEGADTRREYGELLLRLATEKVPDNSPDLSSGLLHGSSRRKIKRRLLEIKRTGKRHVFLSCLAIGCIGGSGILTGLVYEKPMVMADDETETIPIQNQKGFLLDTIKGVQKNDWVEVTLDSFEPSEYDWIDKNGEIHQIDNRDKAMKSCDHVFLADGEVRKHHIEDFLAFFGEQRYEALKCSRCGYMQRGEERVYIPSDNYWDGEDGTVINIDSIVLEMDSCSHVYDSHGKVYEHRSNAEKGCTTAVYEGLRCVLCGQIKAGDQQCEIQGTHCVHRYND